MTTKTNAKKLGGRRLQRAQDAARATFIPSGKEPWTRDSLSAAREYIDELRRTGVSATVRPETLGEKS